MPRARPAAASQRKRQLLAVGGVVLALAIVVGVVVANQLLQGSSSGAPRADRHSLGNANAPVTITEWSDFQ